MVSLPTLGTLPLIGRPLRDQLMAPVARSLAGDRLPFEQYTDPPGDPGLFGPGSATWRVHADPAMLVGGLAALMLQTLHPLAIAGVEEHSNYREDPLGRLSRTGSFVTGTTFGSTEAAERMIKLVRGIHRKVSGTAPDGRRYSADDPALVTWVHVTEVSSFLRAHQRFTPFPVRGDQADRYFHETAIIAERLGGEDIPRSRVAVRAYFRHIRPELEAGEQALGAIEFLSRPMPGPRCQPGDDCGAPDRHPGRRRAAAAVGARHARPATAGPCRPGGGAARRPPAGGRAALRRRRAAGADRGQAPLRGRAHLRLGGRWRAADQVARLPAREVRSPLLEEGPGPLLGVLRRHDLHAQLELAVVGVALG